MREDVSSSGGKWLPGVAWSSRGVGESAGLTNLHGIPMEMFKKEMSKLTKEQLGVVFETFTSEKCNLRMYRKANLIEEIAEVWEMNGCPPVELIFT